jgi:hypothetical protein
MNYREFIPKRIEDEIASWNFSPALHRAFWEAILVELRSRPDHLFRQVVAPFRALIASFSVVDPDAGETRTFVVYVDAWRKPGLRTVLCVTDADRPLKQSPADSEKHQPSA